jgi:biotin synthase
MLKIMNLFRILNKEKLSKREIIFLILLNNTEECNLLYDKAESITRKYFGNQIHLRGIIEFSNYCRQNCFYCGLRKSNKSIKRFRMGAKEILEVAESIYGAGIKTIVLQSGEDPFYTGKFIEKIIKQIKNSFDVAITLSVGERPFKDYDIWRNAGADRYLLKHETANKTLYNKIHPGQNFETRIKHLKYLKQIGFQIGSGNIVGLPNQTAENIADDIILCNKLDVDMASFSPFIHAENTPFHNIPNGNLRLLLNTMAVARIVLHNVHIPATTALATLNKSGREKGLRAGANVIMPSFTPVSHRKNYLIYKGKKCIGENPMEYLLYLKTKLAKTGKKFSHSKGNSLKPVL